MYRAALNLEIAIGHLDENEKSYNVPIDLDFNNLTFLCCPDWEHVSSD